MPFDFDNRRDRERYDNWKTTEPETWGAVEEQIQRSRIRRINWRGIFGTTLTKAILSLMREGKTADQCAEILCKKICEQTGEITELQLKNLRISVCARYAEAKTEAKILRAT